MAFVQRDIEISVKLAQRSGMNQPNTFAQSGTDSLTLRNLRMSVRVQNSGSPAGSKANVRIWGLTPSVMNQLSTLGLSYNVVPLNTLTIKAGSLPSLGNAASGMAVLYSGIIQSGFADFASMPDVPFVMEANSGIGAAVSSADPTSFTGETKVSEIMSGLARQMGLAFEDNEVKNTLTNPYFFGNLSEQVDQCRIAANINAETIGGTLAIWPKGSYRTTQTQSAPLISESNQTLIGAPTFTQSGIMLYAVFNPLVSFGALIRVQSAVLGGVISAQSLANREFRVPADSKWAVYKLDHALDCQTPGGQWMSTIAAFNPHYPQPLQQR
jgi:hypothetical protein